ncbi:hypothetical protein SynA1840_00152 [Synechococcus sp. A18-40]|nr:hypothetical protein SynA1840_00152 [Synechococcus sp. A18-40]
MGGGHGVLRELLCTSRVGALTCGRPTGSCPESSRHIRTCPLCAVLRSVSPRNGPKSSQSGSIFTTKVRRD